jgi:hypothetical protein
MKSVTKIYRKVPTKKFCKLITVKQGGKTYKINDFVPRFVEISSKKLHRIHFFCIFAAVKN